MINNNIKIILVHIDALRYDYAKREGIISSLDNEWLIYPESYTPFYGTDPLVTTVLTGLYPPKHGIIRHGLGITRTEITLFNLRGRKLWLPRLLSMVGFKNIAIDMLGRWQKTDFYLYINPSSFYFRLVNIFKYSLLRSGKIGRKIAQSIFINPPSFYPPAKIVLLEALKLLKRFRNERVLMYIHLWDTHTPYLVDSHCLRHDIGGATPLNNLLNKIPDLKWREYLENYVAWNASTIEEVVERYRASVCSVSRALFEFFAKLKELEIYDDSLIVVFSDHGEALGERGSWFDHHIPHQSVIRVMLAIKPPAQIEIGKIRKNVKYRASLIDIAPTVLDLLSKLGNKKFEKIIKKMEGTSLFSPSEKDRVLYFGMVADKPGIDVIFGLIIGKLKYVVSLYPKRPSACPRCGVQHYKSEELLNIYEDTNEEMKKDLMTKITNDDLKLLRNLLRKHLEKSRHPEIYPYLRLFPK